MCENTEKNLKKLFSKNIQINFYFFSHVIKNYSPYINIQIKN